MSTTITNLEQVRAAHALKAAPELLKAKADGGDQISGYHSLIITNGLLAALAFSYSKGKGQHPVIAGELLAHLAALQAQGLFPGDAMGDSFEERLESLVYEDAYHLAIATDECMAYLAFLKRFVRAQSNDKQ